MTLERDIPLAAFPLHQEIFIRLHRELRSQNPLWLPKGPTFRIRLGHSTISFPEPPLEGLGLMDFADPLNVPSYFTSWEDIEYHSRNLTGPEHHYYEEVLNPDAPHVRKRPRRQLISCLVDPDVIEAFRDRIGEAPRTDIWGDPLPSV